MAKKVKRWSTDEKAKILADLAGASAATVAEKHGVTQSTIYQWKKAAGMGGGKMTRKNGAQNGHAEPHAMPPLEIKGLQSWLRECVRQELRAFFEQLGGTNGTRPR